MSLLLLLPLSCSGSPSAPASSGQPARIERPGFALQLPAGWTVDEQDPDYDPDHLFSLDGPEDCGAMFFLADKPLDADARTEAQVQTHLPLFEEVAQEPFDSWGRYPGAGVDLRGSFLGEPGVVRVFSHSEAERSFTVVEQCVDRSNGSGFETLRSTFELK